jgi:hypothetical protein
MVNQASENLRSLYFRETVSCSISDNNLDTGNPDKNLAITDAACK